MMRTMANTIGRSVYLVIIVGLAIFTDIHSAVGSLQKVNVGIYGGQVMDMATRDNSGTNDLMIGVDCNRGVFYWDASAACWDSVTWPDVVGKASDVEFNTRAGREADMYAILTDMSNQTLLAASESGGAAGTWTNLGYGSYSTLRGHSSGMYVGMFSGEVYRNQGSIHASPTLLDTFSRQVASISVYDANTFFVALTFDAGQTNIYRVQDTGGGFTSYPLTMPTATASGSGDVHVNLIGVDPADSNRLFCTGADGANVQVYMSTNGGVSWSQSWDKNSSGSTNFPGGYPAYIIFDGDRTFISHSCLMRDDDTWTYQANARTPIVQVGGITNVVETHPNDGALAVDAVDNTRLYVATDWALAEYSCSALGLWGSGSEVGTNNGITGVILNDMDFFSYSATSKVLWIAAKSGLGRTVSFDPKNPATTSTPADWIFPQYPDGSPATTIEIHPTKPNVILGGHNSGRIFKTTTGTNLVSTNILWSQVFEAAAFPTVFPSLAEHVTISDLHFVPSSPSNVYASAFRWQPPITNGGVFYSADEGVTWSVDYSNEPVNAIYVSDHAVWAGIGSAESSGRGLRVRQGPASWWNPGTGLAMDSQIVNDLDGTQTGSTVIVYCAAEGGVYKGVLPSTSMGGWSSWTWTDLTPNVTYWNTNFVAVTVNPDNPNEVFLAAGNAILRSLNGGTTWTVLTGTGTISHEDVRVLVYDDLLSGTANGLYSYLIEDEASSVVLDFDGDGTSDITVYAPENGYWISRESSTLTPKEKLWGWNDVVPVSAQYDADDMCDFAVYWPLEGMWYIFESATDTARLEHFGWNEVIPVPGDYDGDGTAQVAVYYPASGTWLVQKADGSTQVQPWGWSDAVPVPADYDGDGKNDFAVYGKPDGTWLILNSSGGSQSIQFGWDEMWPLPADYDGDGKADMAGYWPAGGYWYVRSSKTGEEFAKNFGWNETQPVPADYTGDGITDLAVYYQSNGLWYVYDLVKNTQQIIPWGWSEAYPVLTQYWIDLMMYFPSERVQ